MQLRIPFPERISYTGGLLFGSALAVVQLLEHTDPLFAACCFAFVMVAITAFNTAGGLYRAAGAYIFFNALFTLELGLVVKAFLGEPAQKNLAGTRSVEVYLLGMVSLLAAAYVESRFRSRRSLLTTVFPAPDLGSAYKGAAVIGMGVTLLLLLPFNIQSGSIGSLVRNTNLFLPFSVILGVIHTVRSTNGKRSITPWIAVLILVTTAQGLLDFSKQALFTPAFCWVIGAAVSRFRLRLVNIISLALVAYIAMNYATPYSQYGRNFRAYGGGPFANATVAYYMITHIEEVKREYTEDAAAEFGSLNYFDRPMGIFDRLQMIGIDDALITITDRKGTFGYGPVIEGFENLVPHFIWPDKPTPYFGNTYAHELGGLDNDDLTTGVSFSISSDAYHEGGLPAVLIGIPLGMILIFCSFSYLVGDLRNHPAALILTLALSHLASENGFYGIFAMIDVALLCVAFGFVCKYIFPIAASVFEPQRLADNVVSPVFAGS